MKYLNWVGISTLLLAVIVGTASASEFRTIEWKELKPADWQAPPVRDPSFYDRNPDAQVQTALDAPVIEELHGDKVRIPGYVVQLEGDDRRVTEFLLVPYFGACIHVPPPPPNQIIHVSFPEGVPYAVTYDAVWVSGTIKVERKEGDIAVVGYQIDAADVVSYFN